VLGNVAVAVVSKSSETIAGEGFEKECLLFLKEKLSGH
jgi:hypothetical protein